MKTLAKSLEVLELFSKDNPYRGVSEISRELEINKSTVHSILNTFKEKGYVIFDEATKKYGLGYKFYDMSHRVSFKDNIISACLPVMRDLVKECDEDVSLSIQIEDKIVAIAIVEGNQYIRQRIFIGRILPLYVSAGRCFLAYMDEAEFKQYLKNVSYTPFTGNTVMHNDRLIAEVRKIRKELYSESREEYWKDAASFGFPVFYEEGKIAAVITIHTTLQRVLDSTARKRYLQSGIEKARMASSVLSKIGNSMRG